jgi:hypothetical protein
MEKFGSGVRDGKNSDPGYGMEKFGSGMEKVRIRDPRNTVLISVSGIFFDKFDTGSGNG